MIQSVPYDLGGPSVDFIRGHIEPHAPLMDIPPGDHLLLKIMSLDNFERSLQDGYLHFNRVDCYDVDPHDGEIAPEDRKLAKQVAFEKAAKQTLADYYDQCRSRS
ncbi:hypothetical protein [Tabrizicola fusiformis]|uniref:hypothetical protein n=1 Tax=Tabrizicola sp. SY72 TaxID=2741673 RepID=UPI001571C606|nr:hypothetical protein [Tabrizicola sp. SY72]NTT85757.1 hypothetical protein [Tabrizicola sp. SY72]